MMKVLNKLAIEPYGYSHGDKIGFKLSGIEPGYKIDFKLIDQLLIKRKGSYQYNTTRSESEELKLLSGFNQNVTTGETIWIEIEQNNFRSSDYEFGLVRPGHADLSAYQKYGEDWNYSGGGQFSGRLTTLYVIAGEIARQVLMTKTKLQIFGHVASVGEVEDQVTNLAEIQDIQADPFPMVSSEAKAQATKLLTELKSNGDSIGGKLDIYIDQLAANYGDDFFASLESKMSFLLFSIPAVKAIEFGYGTKFATAKGSEVVEQYSVSDGQVKSVTNYNGGISGGIANLAAPIKLSITIKPTSSIFQTIETVKFNGQGFEPAVMEMRGRHDSFIANRALWPAIGLLNILFLDLEMERNVRTVS